MKKWQYGKVPAATDMWLKRNYLHIVEHGKQVTLQTLHGF